MDIKSLSKHHFKLSYISTRHLTKLFLSKNPTFLQKSPLKKLGRFLGGFDQSLFHVQGRFDQRTSSVTQMLQDLNWRTLEQWRVDGRLTLMYNITYDLVAKHAQTT